ncbi:MAG: SDR family NAD(P)-dependent oxidoreductase [Candidatus Binatia bacterium]|nr:SDR family NAD(P)-dependent oxidoreductase [Candidatus Binatia bacterium]
MIRTYKDAVCLITGGASGIGEALGRELARRGALVVLADRQEDAAARVTADIQTSGGKAEPTSLDVRDADAFERIVAKVVTDHGRIDYLFNNAGIGVGGAFEEHTLDDWRYIMDVNVMGVVYGCHAAYPRMIEQGFGHIVNTASMAGQCATPGLAAYGTTKHAVVGLTRSLRIEAAEYGVRASAFCPGVINTKILQKGGEFGRVRGPAALFEPEAVDTKRAMDVDAFATKALDQVARNREIIVLPFVWTMIRWLDRLSEGLMSRFQTYAYKRMNKEIERRAHKHKSASVGS